MQGTDCQSAPSKNDGCGILSASDRTTGRGFNEDGGGVYVTAWVDGGISVCTFRLVRNLGRDSRAKVDETNVQGSSSDGTLRRMSGIVNGTLILTAGDYQTHDSLRVDVTHSVSG